MKLYLFTKFSEEYENGIPQPIDYLFVFGRTKMDASKLALRIDSWDDIEEQTDMDRWAIGECQMKPSQVIEKLDKRIKAIVA